MLLKSFEKHREDRAWDMYLMRYTHMEKGNYVDFEKFYDKPSLKRTNTKVSYNEISDDVDYILESFKNSPQLAAK
ncbi:hypothetical protein D3C71_2136180 [compost metagenome]